MSGAYCSKNKTEVLKCVFSSCWVFGYWGNTRTLECTISKVPSSARGPPSPPHWVHYRLERMWIEPLSLELRSWKSKVNHPVDFLSDPTDPAIGWPCLFILILFSSDHFYYLWIGEAATQPSINKTFPSLVDKILQMNFTRCQNSVLPPPRLSGKLSRFLQSAYTRKTTKSCAKHSHVLLLDLKVADSCLQRTQINLGVFAPPRHCCVLL